MGIRAMPKPYSEDLRERVVKLYKSGKNSLEVAEHYEVSHDFVSKMVNQYDEIGSLSPKKSGGRKKPIIEGENLKWLKGQLEKNNDLTIKELQYLFLKERKLKVKYNALRNAILRLGFSLKKRCFQPMKKIKMM